MLPISPTAATARSAPLGRTTRLRLTAAGVLLATAATGAVSLPDRADAAEPTPTASPTSSPTASPTSSPTAAPAATTISVRALQQRVSAGRRAVVTGNLRVAGEADAAGREVTLEARARGERDFSPVGVVVAGPGGGLRLTDRPEATTSYRWSYAGSAAPTPTAPATSGVVDVRVADPRRPARRLATTLSVRAVPRGDTATDVVRGTLRAGRVELRGRSVVLLSRTTDQAGWRYVATDRTDRVGVTRFRVAPAVATTYRLRFGGTSLLRPVASGVVQVAPRPRVSATVSPTTLDPGATATVSGLVVRDGQPLAGLAVDLLSRPSRGGQPLRVVASGTTGTDGTVSLSDTPATGTTYRLAVRSTPETAAATSSPVSVRVRTATSVSIRARQVPQGTAITGALRGGGRPVDGVVLALFAQAPGSTTWTQVDQDRTGRRGGVQLVRTAAPGTSYRWEFAGTDRFAPTTSGTVVD